MKTWLGIPREEIPWYPTIDAGKCTGCRACVDFCRNDVLEFDEDAEKTTVTNPFHCVVECNACERLCPEGAISFLEEPAWISFVKDRLSRRRGSTGSGPAGGDHDTADRHRSYRDSRSSTTGPNGPTRPPSGA